jgi:hypothetical protein
MHIKDYPPFLKAYRPYHQPLKTARWACSYGSEQKKIKGSHSQFRVYIYLIIDFTIHILRNEIR